jgi:hypothetical protein
MYFLRACWSEQLRETGVYDLSSHTLWLKLGLATHDLSPRAAGESWHYCAIVLECPLVSAQPGDQNLIPAPTTRARKNCHFSLQAST